MRARSKPADVFGYELIVDVFAQHFAEVEDIQTNYLVKHEGIVMWEGEDLKALRRFAWEAKTYFARLESWAEGKIEGGRR